jgi:hypothetical protein
MIGRIEETSASFEARYAPRFYPTPPDGEHPHADFVFLSERKALLSVDGDRAHGSGAPSGERNGNYRHGFYTAEALAERKPPWLRSLRRF